MMTRRAAIAMAAVAAMAASGAAQECNDAELAACSKVYTTDLAAPDADSCSILDAYVLCLDDADCLEVGSFVTNSVASVCAAVAGTCEGGPEACADLPLLVGPNTNSTGKPPGNVTEPELPPSCAASTCLALDVDALLAGTASCFDAEAHYDCLVATGCAAGAVGEALRPVCDFLKLAAGCRSLDCEALSGTDGPDGPDLPPTNSTGNSTLGCDMAALEVCQEVWAQLPATDLCQGFPSYVNCLDVSGCLTPEAYLEDAVGECQAFESVCEDLSCDILTSPAGDDEDDEVVPAEPADPAPALPENEKAGDGDAAPPEEDSKKAAADGGDDDSAAGKALAAAGVAVVAMIAAHA